MLTSLRRYFTDQQSDDAEHAEYYLGAAVAIETALKLLAGPGVPKAASAPESNGVAKQRVRRMPRKKTYDCVCGKSYTIQNSLASHLKRQGPEHHRVT